MKALEYLYRMKKANDEMGMSAKNLDEAIEELEDLENRSCDNCKHFNTSLLLSNPPKKYCEKLNISFDIGGCGDYWESINEK